MPRYPTHENIKKHASTIQSERLSREFKAGRRAFFLFVGPAGRRACVCLFSPKKGSCRDMLRAPIKTTPRRIAVYSSRLQSIGHDAYKKQACTPVRTSNLRTRTLLLLLLLLFRIVLKTIRSLYLCCITLMRGPY